MAGDVTKASLTFGQIALRNGLVTKDQVMEAIEFQKAQKAKGLPAPRLGELMVQKGYLTEAQVRTIFRLQGREGGHKQVAGYKIHSKIGEGGMGAVYKATQLSMDRTVALKILAPRLAKNDEFVARFLREARAVAKLSHVNIIAGIDVGESNGLYYFAMEFVDGPTALDVLVRGGAMDEERAVEVTLQMARALENAHKNKMVHRDVKPENIMLARSGQAKLCDLGLAKSVKEGEHSGVIETDPGKATAGTPNYIAPEVAKGNVEVDIRADIYSLGASLYHMATGEPPFIGSAAVVVTRHLTEDPVPAHLRKPGVSRAVSAVVTKAMEKDPEDRYANPTKMAQDLERVQRGEWPTGTGPMPTGSGAAPAAAAPAAAVPVGESPAASEGDGPKIPDFSKAKRRRRRRRRR
jgi:serine/threonine-protein kinase